MEKKKIDRDKVQLDAYEQEIEDSITEADLQPPTPDQLEKMKELQQIFIASKKRKSISLRIQKDELEKLKEKAEKEGLPYQTLIHLLVRKYNRGEIKLQLSE